MNQQTEGKPGITLDKLRLIKYSRKIILVKMLCNPVFVLVYWYFCRTLYQFCMYGGVKKRGTVLAACMIFFLGYLICYCVRIRKIKVEENLPEKRNTVKWYGFSKNSFYFFDKDNCFWVKKCNDEDKDYLRLKYSELPKYKHFFWKIPTYLVLLMITVVTICGVIKSGTNLNGKLAWYLFDLRHTPIVVEPQEDTPDAETGVIEETMSYFSPVTMDAHTGEVVDLEDIWGCTWSQLSQQLYGDERLNSYKNIDIDKNTIK